MTCDLYNGPRPHGVHAVPMSLHGVALLGITFYTPHLSLPSLPLPLPSAPSFLPIRKKECLRKTLEG